MGIGCEREEVAVHAGNKEVEGTALSAERLIVNEGVANKIIVNCANVSGVRSIETCLYVLDVSGIIKFSRSNIQLQYKNRYIAGV